MKVTIGSSVKNIPKKFQEGVVLIKEAQLESPTRKRLTPFERFLFAEATWRKGISPYTQDYLERFTPEKAMVQINRSGDKRYVVDYESDDRSLRAMALVPKKVYNRCPLYLRTKQYTEW